MKRSFTSLFATTAVIAAASFQTSTGFAQGGLMATPPESLTVKEGFQVELLYTVPKDQQGSWVSMCVDDEGRFIVSDQYGGLYRVTVPTKGASGDVKVEPIDLNIGHAQGLLYAFDSVYAVVNHDAHQGRGLYRIRDTNGDDQFDHVELLKKFEEQGGEHGPHAVILGPEGKSLYIVVGNQTSLPEYDHSRVPELWGEDQLLPRIYGRGFMKGVEAPRGWIAKTDPEGQTWEIMATGFRNEYDAAFNREGELFTYDADMEWDMSTPWYRPTRVNHVVSGAEYGWRNGSGKWPAYFPDSLGAVVDIGPGSPTGVAFGYGAKFPLKYESAFYIADWSYGKLFAVHLKPDGAGYTGEFEEFIAGTPLPLTDLVVSPKDGAMYFAIGGRRTQSALYRVTYVGNERIGKSTADKTHASDRALRQSLEAYHVDRSNDAIDEIWSHLGSSDRNIAWAARVALEHRTPSAWQAKALAESDTDTALAALLALSRAGDNAAQSDLIAALRRMEFSGLTAKQKIAWLRTAGLAFIRMGEPDSATRSAIASALDPSFPSANTDVNAMLIDMMVYLQSPSAAEKGVAMLNAAPNQEEQIHIAKALRLLRTGWTPELQADYFGWFNRAAAFRGGASFGRFIDSIKTDALDGLTEDQKVALKPVFEAEVKQKTALEAMAEAMVGRSFVKNWTVEDLATLADLGLRKRDFERGRKMFGAAACFACHRFNQEGGALGPDLTGSAGRFNSRDLLESIIEPSKAISDQYAPSVFTMKDGSTVTGRVMNLSGDRISVAVNMFDPNQTVGVNRNELVSITESPVSMMPEGLLNMLNQDEILDLIAYLLSAGDSNHEMFR